MKKIIAVMRSAILVLSSLSVSITAFAVKTTDVEKTQIGSSDTYYEFDAQTKTLRISGNGAIPDMTSNDTSQPWAAWRSDGSIENIVIEEGITRIGNYALYYVCAENVQLPSTLSSIGNYALSYNVSIKSLEVPFGVKLIGVSAFENCIELTRISLPDTLTTINKSAFKQCYKLENILIPYSVASIGNYAFQRCSVLNSVTFESLSSPVKIGSYAFMNCPLLSELAIPLNATVGSYAYGFDDSKRKYENTLVKAFPSTDAVVYAMTRSIAYELMDKIPLELGIVNTNEYIEETVSDKYEYSFTPKTTQVYNIYSTGDLDLLAVLSDETGELITSDDISNNNLNFCITAELEAGREYTVTVSSRKTDGIYSVIAYPDEIEAFGVIGSIELCAEDGTVAEDGVRYFDITNDMLSEFVLNIEFGGGFSDTIFFENKYFDNKTIEIADVQKEAPFTCGNNSQFISIGEVKSPFNVFIEHSYEEEIIPYTVDDDGYSLFTCVLCGNSYKDNFVPTPAVTVSGTAYLMEKPDGTHSNNIPYPHATFFANERTYYIDENGRWSVNTFDDLDLVFENENGKNVRVHIDVDGEDVEYGEIVFEGYDFNKDGYVNAKDYAIFLKQKEKKLGKDYWRFAYKFI